MTICVAVKVHDCIVFATDSATSMSSVDANGAVSIANVYSHGNKLFNLYKGLPICAMTCGMGNIGNSSIGTLAKDFRKLITSGPPEYKIDSNNYTIADIANKARKFLFEEKFESLSVKPDSTFDFWIGGYSSNSEHGEVWKIQISDAKCKPPFNSIPESSCTIDWSGQPEAINRLLLGYSQMLPASLKSAGVSDTEMPVLMKHIALNTMAPILEAAMPVRDAIDLAYFLAHTTVSYVRFLPGANTVGGDIDIATITKHEGFKWISRKHYYTRDLNPLETDHV